MPKIYDIYYYVCHEHNIIFIFLKLINMSIVATINNHWTKSMFKDL